MTRIQSVFNLLKRVGFALLLLGAIIGTANAQVWRQVELVNSEFDVALSEMVSDSFGNLQIYFTESLSASPGLLELKFMYVSGNGAILYGPITLNDGLASPFAAGMQVAGDGMTRSWCIWQDSLAGSHQARGLLLAGFDSHDHVSMDPVYLGLDTFRFNIQPGLLDLTYRPQDQTLHLAEARFVARYSKFSTAGEVLVWKQFIDTVFITERVHIATSPSGDVWAVYRNEDPNGNGAEAMFIKFNNDGSMAIRHPFGTAEAHSSTAVGLTFGLNGDVNTVVGLDAFDGRYCRLDSLLSVQEWHELSVEHPYATGAIGQNTLDDVLVAWSEFGPLHSDIYASVRLADGNWTMNGAAVGLQLSDPLFMHVAPVGNMNWAIVTSLETSDSRDGLVLFTTDTTSTNVGHEPIEEQPSFVIFPNPSNGIFSIGLQTETGGQFFVYDVLGRLVTTVPAYQPRAGLSIDLSAAPTGTYFVFSTNPHVKPFKILLQR